MNQRLLRLLVVLTFSAGMGSALWSLEVDSTLTPSQFGFEPLTNLINDQGPAAGAMSILRLAMFAASVYVAGLMLLTLIARLTRRSSLEHLVARLTPRALRTVLGVLAISTAFVAQPAYAQSSGDAPVMIRLGDTTTTAPNQTSPTAASPTTAGPTMRWIGPAGATPIPAATIWTVERGDHLWHITEATLLGRLDRLPTVQEAHDYWIALIAANRDRLINPDNPSLIYPGQEFVLPAP